MVSRLKSLLMSFKVAHKIRLTLNLGMIGEIDYLAFNLYDIYYLMKFTGRWWCKMNWYHSSCVKDDDW